MIHAPEPPDLVDALGNPLREEPVSTFANNPKPFELLSIGQLDELVKQLPPAPPFNKVARCDWLQVKNEETGELRHSYIDPQRRILFLSPEVFEKVLEARTC